MENPKTTQALHVTCKVRPARIAFLMEKPEHSVLQEILSSNTLLWGGLLNPVVILDGSTCPLEQFPSYTYEEGIVTFLKEFDPDVLINYSDTTLPDALSAFKSRTFGRSSLRWNPWGKEEIHFFLEVWPFVAQYWRKVHQFLKQPTQDFTYMDLTDAGDLRSYLYARFGAYPVDGDGNNILTNNFAATPSKYDEDFRKSFRWGQKIFPLQLTAFNLNIPSPGFVHSHVFFLLDPTNVFDVVDYWNLKATGGRVFALPIGHYQDFANSILAFAEQGTYPINENVMNHPSIIKAKSVSDESLMDVGRWVQGLGVKDISCQRWVPQYGERGYRVARELIVRPPTASEVSQTVVLTNGFGMMEGPVPDCEFAGPSRSQHWAMELQVLGSGDEEHTWRLPWLRSECDEYVNHTIGHGHELTKSRVSKQGIVVVRRGERESLGIQEPVVKEVLKAFLKTHGFNYQQTSSPGLALERILDQLGGLFGCRILQNSGVREVIQKLSTGSPMHVEHVRSTLLRNTPLKRKQQIAAARNRLENLIQKRVLRQGINLQCERCQRRCWYGLAEFTDDFKCKRCFHLQQVPVFEANPWEYVSDGLFTLPGKMAGSLTSAIALVCLNYFFHDDFKYVASFEYGDGSHGAERDFAVFSSGFLEDDVDVIFGECKTVETFGDASGMVPPTDLPDLQDKEKNDTRELGRRTGAYLAFCTLATDFSDADKQFFGELVKEGQKLILLTKKHLEMSYIDASHYKNQVSALLKDVELLSRLTTIDTLGQEFAKQNRIWAW